MKNKRGQMMIFGLMVLVMIVIVFSAFIPVFQDSINNARGSDGLNCVSTLSICSASQGEPCYNSSIRTETTSCLIMDIYLPYIIIAVLLLGVSALMAGKLGLFSPQPTQPEYPGY